MRTKRGLHQATNGYGYNFYIWMSVTFDQSYFVIIPDLPHMFAQQLPSSVKCSPLLVSKLWICLHAMETKQWDNENVYTFSLADISE